MQLIGQKNVAVCFSTKDRVEFSKKTLPPVLADADKFDLFIVDGSVTEGGKNYAHDLNTEPKIAGVYCNITGGADLAIVYALSFMLDRGYEYLGLVENDVLLDTGWFDRIMEFFSITNVGAVSARCYSDRILEKSNGCAVMANVGAGMVLFSREGAEAILDYYRNGSFAEYCFWPEYYVGVRSDIPHEIADPKQAYQMTADWFFESSMLARGLIALACTPTMARSVDDTSEALQLEASEYQRSNPLIFNSNTALIGHYDPGLGSFLAQPHQIFKALPNAFRGDWKLVWAKHNGPFGMRITDEGELTLPVYGNHMSILLDITEGATVEAWVDGIYTGVLKKSSGYCSLQFEDTKKRNLIFKFKGQTTVMTILFPCPQNWFQDGYALRYKDLEKYL